MASGPALIAPVFDPEVFNHAQKILEANKARDAAAGVQGLVPPACPAQGASASSTGMAAAPANPSKKPRLSLRSTPTVVVQPPAQVAPPPAAPH